jgi:hypothetical protein
MTLEQMTTTAGAAFAFPIDDGRFSVCRVLLDSSSHAQRGESLDFMTRVLDGLRKQNFLVACSKWIGNRIPRADDPALRTILHLNHHSYVDEPNVLWISSTEELPEDFIHIGTILPSPNEIAIYCIPRCGSWPSLTWDALTQWRWDNERDALLADERKQEEDRIARLINSDDGVVIDSHGLTHRGVRLAWEQVREVGVEGSGNYDLTPYLTITSDTGEFTVRQGIDAFPAIVNALDRLPAFPSLKFRKVLDRSFTDDTKEIVWSRDVTEQGADLKPS